MTARQGIEISLLVAEGLSLELSPETRGALARRQDVGDITDRLRTIGAVLGISYLMTVLDETGLRDAVRASTAPLVLVGESPDVVVLGLGRRRRSTDAVRVTADGQVIPLPGDATAIERAVVAIVGTSPQALSPLSLSPPSDPLRTTLEMMVETRSMPRSAAPLKERNVFVRVAQLLARDKRDIIILFIFAALAGLFALTLPLSVGAIVQLVQGGLVLQPVVILIGYVVVGTLASGGLQILQLRVVERIQQRVFARLALEFTFRIPRIRYETAMHEDLPETMNRFFEAVTIQKSLSKFLLDTSTAMLTVLAGLILLTFYHPYFTFFGVLLLLVLGGILWFSGPRGLETSFMESTYKYRAVHWLEEQARAFHAFKFAGRSALGIQRMDEILSGYLTYRGKHFNVLMQQTVAIVLFRTIIIGGFLVLGTQLVIDRQISLGQFVASELIIVTVLTGVEKLILSMSTIYDILTSAEKVGYVSDLPLDDMGGSTLPVGHSGMSLELRGVSYRYHPGARNVLCDLTTRVEAGERLAITGYEGAGRTTLLKLMSGLLGDFEGTLLFDGHPVRTLDRSVLRERVGQYLSATNLFDGTIMENVAVGRLGIDAPAVRRAIADVGLTREIEEMPNGLDSQITHGGRRMSHNTAIKLLFAQAIAGTPRLLVVDDLFQNLQGDDRRRLIDVLVDRTRATTVIAASHDPVLLSRMDRVIVFEQGAIRAQGAFDTLLEDPYIRSLIDADARAFFAPDEPRYAEE